VDDFTSGTESFDTADTSSEVAGPIETSGPVESQAGGNPAWESLRTKLDPVTFKLIEPDLKGFDSNAEKRISGLNQQLKGYTSLGTPDQVKSYANIARQIDAQPEVIYQALGNFLQQNGRLPQTAGEVRQVQAEADAQDEGDLDPYDERLSQLQQQQEQMRQFLEEQENQRMSAEADQALDAEISQLKQAFPSFTDADIAEVIQKAAWQAQTQGNIPPLAQVAQSYIDNTVNRIRSVPRPGDSAPRLVPTSGGGVPQNTQQTSLGKRSNADVQALVAGIISQSR
jgi:hypothetical protein